MGVHFPTRCECGAVLQIHCGSTSCGWLRCRNPRCVWENRDVERGVRVHRDGHVEQVPA
jgi:hypothetical protein